MTKHYLYLVLLTIFSCNSKNNQDMSQSQQHTALIDQYFAFFNDHAWDKMASLYSAEAEFKDPSLGPGIVKQTRTQISQKYAELNEMFPDIKDEVVRIYPSGESHIIVEFISSGTAPDGSVFELPVCTIFTIENGLITKDFTYYDNFEE